MPHIKQIFVNLPVRDLEKTKTFWTTIGFSLNPQFTDEKAAALVLGDNIFAMLLTAEFFKTFTKKEICDAGKQVEVINAISVERREQVGELAKSAEAAGGKALEIQDHGWMYSQAFEDVDGHRWEVLHMDLGRLPAPNA